MSSEIIIALLSLVGTLASLAAPRYIKFCIKGTGANITAKLTPL